MICCATANWNARLPFWGNEDLANWPNFKPLIAEGTQGTPRLPAVGGIEARTGLRIMPTFPRSPLSFRTAAPCTDQTGTPSRRSFYFPAFNGSVSLPVAGCDHNSDWPPLLAGAPAPVTQLPGPESGPCFTDSHSPWPPPFAPLVVKNGLNILSFTSGGMPARLSRILISTRSPRFLVMAVRVGS